MTWSARTIPAALLLGTTPAIAQNPTVLPYQASVNPSVKIRSDCIAERCVLTFPVAPTGKRLVVQHVAVTYTLAIRSSNTSVILNYLGGSQITMPLVVSSLGGTRYTVSSPVTAYVDEQRTPLIIIYGPMIVGDVKGVLVGTLVDR